MNQLVTDAIILTRTNYGEADRIITVLTPDAGKVSMLARGVRKAKSKLAGGIELFSISNLTYIRGRGELGTLISARLETHYGKIVQNIDRVQLGYELIKQLHKATEDEPEAEYFKLLQVAFAALDDSQISTDIIRFWFQAQLLKLAGHEPNLQTSNDGQSLSVDALYTFDMDAMSFAEQSSGRYKANHIKFLRLTFAGHSPATLQQISGAADLTTMVAPLVQTMLVTHIRVQ